MRRLLYIFLAALLASCAHAPQYRTVQGFIWGTTYHITYCSERDLHDSMLVAMEQINKSLSAFDSASIVSRINRGERVKADAMFAEVLDLSQRVCSLSGGAFDPTLAPLINIWGFGYAEGSAQEPTQAVIDSALALVGIRDCSIDSAGYVHKKADGTQFNFSAVAKGYGVDKVAEVLRRNGCTNYMVEIGGEIALSGLNSRGEQWRIQLDAPTEGIMHQRLQVMQLSDCSIATSGNYRNYRETPDGRRWHTISPATGQPAVTSFLSVTVIAPTTAYADALATALMAMPDSAARALSTALAPQIQTYIITDSVPSN